MCPECGGLGNVWWSFSGKYLGQSRCDDLDELEMCEECHGSGLLNMCDNCIEEEEDSDDGGY
jgi:hypothetical protein